MNIKLVPLTYEYKNLYTDMIVEWKADIEKIIYVKY